MGDVTFYFLILPQWTPFLKRLKLATVIERHKCIQLWAIKSGINYSCNLKKTSTAPSRYMLTFILPLNVKVF